MLKNCNNCDHLRSKSLGCDQIIKEDGVIHYQYRGSLFYCFKTEKTIEDEERECCDGWVIMDWGF